MTPPVKMFQVYVPDEADHEVLSTLHSGYIAQGPVVDEFERRFAKIVGNDYVVSVNSGTSALHLAYVLAGIKKGDEVISTPMTCTATNLPLVTLGAKIVWADVTLTGHINPDDVEQKITKKTKAIVCVDWGGTPCDLDKLRQIADKHGLKLIEDAAHAQGARYKGRPVGTFADYTIFSFQAIKHITTGDGGALVCLDKADYERAKKLRWFGIDRGQGGDSRINQDIEEAGYKFQMNDMAASIGVAALPHLEDVVNSHRLIADIYIEKLDRDFYRFPNEISYDARSSYWIFTMLLPTPEFRDKFITSMKGYDVEVSRVHRRNDEYTVFKKFNQGKLPGLDYFGDRMVCLPCHRGIYPDIAHRIVRLANDFARWEGRLYI